jgi:hypothetical protein
MLDAGGRSCSGETLAPASWRLMLDAGDGGQGLGALKLSPSGTFGPRAESSSSIEPEFRTMKLEISRKTELALAAIRELRRHESPLKGADLAASLDTTATYIPHVLRPLVQRDWIECVFIGQRRTITTAGPGDVGGLILDPITESGGQSRIIFGPTGDTVIWECGATGWVVVFDTTAP